MTDARVGVVGAGAAGAAASYVLDAVAPDAEVTILEKSDVVCGRGATRERHGCVYDYGANYVKSDDERVNDLLTDELDADGLVDAAEPIHVFDGSGTVSEGRDADDHKWTYRAGIADLARRLLDRTDATVRHGARVTGLARDATTETWRATTTGGAYGPFDAVLLTPPAPQTAALVREADWDRPAREALADGAAAVDYRTIWTAVCHYPFEVDRPYYALVNVDDDHDVGWIAREECKPGHVPDGESLLVIQAAPDWSAARYDVPVADNVAALAAAAADVVGDERLADPDWTDHKRWRYALPETDRGLLPGVRRDAEAHDCYVAGDWVPGEARLHAALRSGLAVAERVAYAL